MPVVFLVGMIFVLGGSAGWADDPPHAPAPPRPAFAIPGVEPRAADADAPLAEGFPAATRPGVIEVKNYPAYRGALARGKNASMGSDEVLFYPLFIHITKSQIAMTAPIINSFDPVMIDQPGATGDVAMEFVYRTPTTGPAGAGVGAVVVEDHPAGPFVSLGVQGELKPETMQAAVSALRGWLSEHQTDWVATGPARRLAYHPPTVAKETRLWEVQIPVKPVVPLK